MRRKSPRLGEIGDEVRRHGGDDAFVRVPAGLGQQLLAVSQATEPAEDHGVPNESAVTDGDEVNVQLSSKCDIVQGSKVRRDELMSKTFKNGGCREYAAITSLLPSGSGGMHDAIPRRTLPSCANKVRIKKNRGFDRVPSPILCQLLPLGATVAAERPKCMERMACDVVYM